MNKKVLGITLTIIALMSLGLVLAAASDSDQDGLKRIEEGGLGLDRRNPDSDGDGLCDGGGGARCLDPVTGEPYGRGERDFHGSPWYNDTDLDGLDDYAEAKIAATREIAFTGESNPLHNSDTDMDRIPDGAEVEMGSDPYSNDTDHDGLEDEYELYERYARGGKSDPLDADSDGDGLTDGEEALVIYSDPTEADSDDDGIADGEEVHRGTNVWLEDSDRDGMLDAWEIRYGLDPLADDSLDSADDDGCGRSRLSNLDEHYYRTDPTDPDTDHDKIPDCWEVYAGLDPTLADDHADDDADGLDNYGEYVLNTDPHLEDSDEDGLSDGWEAGDTSALATAVVNKSRQPHDLVGPELVAAGLVRTNPLGYDTEEDGLDDAREFALWRTLGEEAWARDFDGDGGDVPNLAHNLRDPDSDNDGLDDGQEFLVFHTRPDTNDTDGDGDLDNDEIMLFATNPHDARSNRRTAGRTLDGMLAPMAMA